MCKLPCSLISGWDVGRYTSSKPLKLIGCIYIYCHTWNNYSTSKELGIEIMKIGRVFAPQWAAFSSGAVKNSLKVTSSLCVYLNWSYEMGIVKHLENEHFWVLWLEYKYYNRDSCTFLAL